MKDLLKAKKVSCQNIAALTKEEIAAIKELKPLLAGYFEVIDVILFGSKARGDSDVDSDVDLLIITTSKDNWFNLEKISEMTFEVNYKYGTGLSCKIGDISEWGVEEYYTLPFPKNVREDAISLVL